ncbi:MAG: kelch repeat-containing protein [Bacteroidia bacterium]
MKYSVIMLLTVVVLASCKKKYSTTIGAISGPSHVCYGDEHILYSVEKDPEIDYVLWTVPEGATIISGQGTESITVDFGIKQGSICASFYKYGERASDIACIDVTFGVPGKWCRIRDYEDNEKAGAVAFTISDRAFVATGIYGDLQQDDVYELNSSTYTWHKKNNFSGAKCDNAVAFSIGDKGYIGTGNDGNPIDDFWEYNVVTDSWQQKAALPSARQYAFAFTIGNKGYIGGGQNLLGFLNDFYEYSPLSNEWVAKANLPGQRVGATGFSIGTKGYMGLGNDNGTYKNDFWEYDSEDITNGFDANGNPMGKWNARAVFPGLPRYQAVAFSIGNTGYMGTGTDGTNFFSDFYQYDPILNEWFQRDNIPNGRAGAVAFSIGNKGYIGTGYIQETNLVYKRKKDFWMYTQE